MGVGLAGGIRAFWRGLRRSCPLCGERKIFNSWFELKSSCPNCTLNFDREPGWWIGGMIINLAGAMLLFALIFGLALFLFWPDVPWVAVGVVGTVAMIVFPIVFYPMSKTLWLAVDLLMTGMDPRARR